MHDVGHTCGTAVEGAPQECEGLVDINLCNPVAGLHPLNALH